MSLWGVTVMTHHTQDTGCSTSRLWCAFPTDTIMHSTWTSSKIVACSWLVSVVRCFWSSNLVLDEFIPVGKREKDKGEIQSGATAFTYSPTRFWTWPRDSNGVTAKDKMHCEELDTKHQTCSFYWILKTTPREYALSQFHIQENQGHKSL